MEGEEEGERGVEGTEERERWEGEGNEGREGSEEEGRW